MSSLAARAGQKVPKVAKSLKLTATVVSTFADAFCPAAASISLFAVVEKQIIGGYNKKLIIKLNND